MKITKEEDGNIRISGLSLLSKLKEGKSRLKSKRGVIKERKSSEPTKIRITKEDNKFKIKKEVKPVVEEAVEAEVVAENEPVTVKRKTTRKLTEDELEEIYKKDIADASRKGFLPTIIDGYVTYWEMRDGNLIKRFGKYQDIKDKPNIAIRKSDVREVELVEKGKALEEKIKQIENSKTECPEYLNDIENAKRNNDNEVPTMRDGYITYYEIVDDRLIKRYGKYDDVISNDSYYIKYQDRNYYKNMHRKMNLFSSEESEKESGANLEQYNHDVSSVYKELKYYPTPREGYVTYYKDGVKRFGKYEDISNDSNVIINFDDKETAEDYVDLQQQIANLKAGVVEENLDLEEAIVEETTRSLDERDSRLNERHSQEDELDLEEAIVEETSRALFERDNLDDEQIDDDLGESIIEETTRALNERERNIASSDFGRLEDLNLSDDKKEYFEKLADEYIGYLENPTVFTFEKEYKVKSKY